MFKTEKQRADVCNAFLTYFGKPPLFTEDSASPEAIRMLEQGCPWSSSEAAFFRLAWTLWNDAHQVPIMDVLNRLDPRSAAFLGSFVAAWGEGGEAIDRWLAQGSRTRLHPVR